MVTELIYDIVTRCYYMMLPYHRLSSWVRIS